LMGLPHQDMILSRAINNQHPNDPNKRVDGKLQISRESPLKNSLVSILENSGTCNRKSSFPLDYEAMNLNRDLPPLPAPIPTQPLDIRKHTKHNHVASTSDSKGEILLPLCYDPVRDGINYGGIQYHRDSIRYYPKVVQHPPRTSSMRKSNPPDNMSAGNRSERLETAECSSTPSAVRSIALSTSISSCPPNASCGIMGNFMPLKGANLDYTVRTEAIDNSRPK